MVQAANIEFLRHVSLKRTPIRRTFCLVSNLLENSPGEGAGYSRLGATLAEMGQLLRAEACYCWKGIWVVR